MKKESLRKRAWVFKSKNCMW